METKSTAKGCIRIASFFEDTLQIMSNDFDILSAVVVMERGLSFVGINMRQQQQKTHNQLLKSFRAHYGCLPIDLSQIWFDLQTTDDDEVRLTKEEKTYKGFKIFMAANYFLWTHPKNAHMLASRFGLSLRQIQSNQYFWKWIYKLSALIEKKVVWDDEKMGAEDGPIFVASVDGVDFNVWEKPSERYNIDKDLCSYKSRHGAYRYLIAISIWESKCIFVDGPVKAGNVNDLELF